MTRQPQFRTFVSIADLPGPAVQLLADMAATNPFMSDFWLDAFERRLLGAGEKPLYLIVSNGATVLCVLPLMTESNWLRKRWKLRGLANFYTGIYTPAIAPQCAGDSELAEIIAIGVGKWLAEKALGIPVTEIGPLRGKSAFWENALKSACANNCYVRQYPCFGNWYQSVRDLDYETYLAARPGHLRSLIKRKSRLLERTCGFRISIYQNETELHHALTDFETVYGESWKLSEASPPFIREICFAMASRGLLRLGVLYVGDDVPAAAQIWFRIGGAWAVFKLAYRPQFEQYSVGTLLMAGVIESFFATDPPEYLDFLSGDDPYKSDWVELRRVHWGIELFSKRNLFGGLGVAKRTLFPAPSVSPVEI